MDAGAALRLKGFGFSDIFHGKRLSGLIGLAWLENERRTGSYMEMN